MLPENRAFLIRGEDGQEYGPVGLEELRGWMTENRAGIGTEVRYDDPGAPWQAWQYYPELVALLAEVNVMSPVPGQPGLVIARLGKRILACIFDLILSSILASPIVYVIMSRSLPDWEQQFTSIILQPQEPVSPQLLHYILICNLITYLTLTLYMTGFNAAHGRTPGKALLRLRVVGSNGQKPGISKAFLRGVVFVISFYLYGIPLAYAFFNPQRRACHDFVAGTYVVEA